MVGLKGLERAPPDGPIWTVGAPLAAHKAPDAENRNGDSERADDVALSITELQEASRAALDLLLRPLLGVPVSLLERSHELILAALDASEIVVGQLTPPFLRIA